MLIFATMVVNVRSLVWFGECTNRDSLCRHPQILFISVINQLDAQHFCFTINLLYASTCLSKLSKLYYTASGIVTLTGVMIPDAV